MGSTEADRALAVKQKHEGAWLKLPGVTGVDVGPHATEGSVGGIAIRIYVADRSRSPALPTQVEGVPVVVVERRFELQ